MLERSPLIVAIEARNSLRKERLVVAIFPWDCLMGGEVG